MQSYNFFGQSPGQLDPSQSPQALAQAMQLQEYNNPTSANAQSTAKSSMNIDPKAIGQMMQPQQSQQYPPGYVDSAGISGPVLQSYGIAPGASGSGAGPFGLGALSMFGGGGNPLNLSSGSQFSPQDMASLQGAFSG